MVSTLLVIWYILSAIVGVAVAVAIVMTLFDATQRRAYNNRKKWDNES